MNKRPRTAPPPAASSTDAHQRSIFEHVRPPSRWPDAEIFPHNEEGARVKRQVMGLLREAQEALLISPATDLASVSSVLTGWSDEKERPLRLLLGRAPETSLEGQFLVRRGSAQTRLHEAWLDRGIDVAAMRHAARVIQLIDEGRIVARLFPEDQRAMEARMVATDVAVLMGSSALTRAGLELDVQSNLCVTPEDPLRFEAARRFAEELWARGVDWTEGLKELLRALVHLCTWQEALARACALVLDGDWAKAIDGAPRRAPLWPHQEVALSRGLYLLDQCGGLIVADATGSGKTRLGAALFAAALRRRRSRQSGRDDSALAFVPPGVKVDWARELGQVVGSQQVQSHGLLSGAEEGRDELIQSIQSARLLGIDEAHNFLNLSRRTQALRQHLADEVVLFTATPINRGASDLLPLIALIGADNLEDHQLSTVKRLLKSRRAVGDLGLSKADEDELRGVLRQFLIRRTRAHIQQYVKERPEAYREPHSGALLSYPEHCSVEYSLPLEGADRAIVEQIKLEAAKLKGIGWFGKRLERYAAWQADDVSERDALRRVIKSAEALARYHLIHALRSSRAALVEHVEGTKSARAFAALSRELKPGVRESQGQLTKLKDHQIPEWGFREVPRGEAPLWLTDQPAHDRACEEERDCYKTIARLARRLSDAREVAKVETLLEYHQTHDRLLAFDHSLITLELLEAMLIARRAPVAVFSGRGGSTTKRRAKACFDRAADGAMIGLCTDAFSEGFNLQGASCVVHLDMPTVIRAAVQRSGRVDRLNSAYPQVLIAWPKEPELLQPTCGDRLEARRREEHVCIGTDVTRPEDLEALVSPVQAHEDYRREIEDHDRLQDGFECVEGLVKGEDALVDQVTYERMRTTQQRLRCTLSLLPTDTEEWAFFVVAGRRDDPPRWILYKHGDTRPVTDLAQIVRFLREALRPDKSESGTAEHFRSLERQARRLSDKALLSRRRTRALDLLSVVLAQAKRRDTTVSDAYAVVNRLQDTLDEKESVDLRELADRWIQHLRPRWTEHLKTTRRLHLPQLSDLKPELKASPPSLDELAAVFDHCPRVQRIQERLLVAIVATNPQLG